jgi:hypothetical protein
MFPYWKGFWSYGGKLRNFSDTRPGTIGLYAVLSQAYSSCKRADYATEPKMVKNAASATKVYSPFDDAVFNLHSLLSS